ncbi:MAG: caspase family protein [Treponema sp.]|jgi:hypothetical protein|nr:caspase family protein [Treponema sp.]
MKKVVFLLFVFLAVHSLFAQQKYALVIGNGDYTGISKLKNPVNDANDMAAALQGLGFTVDKVLDGNLDKMETAITLFKNRLSVAKNTYGFFFYAGHGVQSGGINYLLPVNANIPSENYLRERAVSVQTMMSELNEAKNELNIIILDACRDNPFGWARSGSRGLSVVSAPVGSIVMYATSANSTAADGTGRNGLFTGELLKSLKTPGLSVQEMFNKTGENVLLASGNVQHPEISIRYFGAAYIGSRPSGGTNTDPAPVVQPNQTYKIGDKGPAGGFVFYDKGQHTDGWRYLEAAPVDLQRTEWGLNGEDVTGTQTGIGTGKRNTELIIAALNRKGESGKAAQLCRAYNLNGYSDWFLPSKDELDLIYKNLTQRGIGDFKATEDWINFTHIYWSSSQSSNNGAWFQEFSDGFQATNVEVSKINTRSVRAIRSF